jgi:hypothetical protein
MIMFASYRYRNYPNLFASIPVFSFISAVILLLGPCPPVDGATATYDYDSLNRLTNVNYGNGSVVSYIYDVAGNRLTYSGVVTNDATLPTISITSPTSGLNFTTSNPTIDLSGTAADNTGITLITWENDRGGIGTATGTTSWNILGIHLEPGTNLVSVTAYDAAGNNSAATLVVTLSAGIPNYSITLNALPINGGAVSGNGSFSAGSSRTVTAAANQGFRFANWTENGSVVGVSPSYNFILNGNRDLVANFVDVPVQPPDQLTEMNLSNGVFGFVLNGPAGSNYVIQVSSNLVNWWPLSTNIIPSVGWLLISDPAMLNQPQQYYRARAIDSAAPNTHRAKLVRNSSQYFSAPSSASLSVTGNFTLEAWVKIATAPAWGQQYAIINKDDNAAQRSFSVWYVNNGGTLQLAANLFATGYSYPNKYLAINCNADLGNVWHHIAVICTIANASSNKVSFYLDGVALGNGSVTDGSGVSDIHDGTADLRIGRGHTDEYFDGYIDDVRLWGATRTEQEIRDNMFKQLVGSESNLRAYWQFNASLGDSTPNGNTLVNNNSATLENFDLPF